MPIFNPFASPMTLSQHYLTWEKQKQWGGPRGKCSSRSNYSNQTYSDHSSCRRLTWRECVWKVSCGKVQRECVCLVLPCWGGGRLLKYCAVRTCLHLAPGVLQPIVPPLPHALFWGDLTVAAGIRPQWVYPHHESRQMLQIRVYFFWRAGG